MIFNISSKISTKVSSFNNKSALLQFCNSNPEFDKLLKTNNLSVSRVQIEKFKKEKNSELKLWTDNNPNLRIIKRIDLNDQFNVDYFRDYLAGIIKTLEPTGITSFTIEIPNYTHFEKQFFDELYFYQSIIEGVLIGNYNFNVYKSEKIKSKNLNINFVHRDKKKIALAKRNAHAVIEGVFFSRDLVNEPANTLTPAEYSKRVKTEFKNTSVTVKVFNEKELSKRKMNAILSVGKASDNKPKLIIAHYKSKVKSKKKIALVGKGVTYDTGGLSIKPTSGMFDMKADMAGSATVFGIIKTASMLNLPMDIIGIVPAVENAISGNAYKPGDIISTSSGKTIEVKDTDAEGRIVLADALEYASKLKPDEIIDFATLTGAAVVALGEIAAGIFTKNEKMSKNIIRASKETYELAWRLPFWDEYNQFLESKIADISNLGPRWGGAITAGKFLEYFVDKNIPWTHIDLAGPSLKHNLSSYTKDYCTGYGVRLISRYLEKV